MASLPPPSAPDMMAPPPASNLPPTPSGGAGMAGLVSGPDKGGIKDVLKQLTLMSSQIDQMLGMLGNALGQSGGEEIQQARQLIEQGVAKFLGQYGEAPANSPTEAGSQFPGGGFSNPAGR